LRTAASALWILLFYLVGEGLARDFGLLPGSLWGMLLLFFALRLGLPEDRVAPAAGVLLRWMPLFFVPVGVGVLAYKDLLLSHAAAVALALVLGTLFTLAVPALLLERR